MTSQYSKIFFLEKVSGKPPESFPENLPIWVNSCFGFVSLIVASSLKIQTFGRGKELGSKRKFMRRGCCPDCQSVTYISSTTLTNTICLQIILYELLYKLWSGTISIQREDRYQPGPYIFHGWPQLFHSLVRSWFRYVLVPLR